MAKLSSYYTLCPLIDQQSLLGVEKDSDSGCAIVTLGRNIVIRYKLQDLKQVNSWSSKERLSTQVIYDQTASRYAAVFNKNQVRVWSEDETDLDKVKRHKFAFSFHTILTLEGQSPVLVRQNGATSSLEWALQNRKSWSSPGVLKENEKIICCQLAHVNSKTYLCALTKIKHIYNYVVVALENETYLEEICHVARIELNRTSEKLVGHTVTQDKNMAYLLTLWSDGKLYRYTLTGSSTNPAPGVLISVVTALNTKHPVVMTTLNETTVAVYGANTLEEGAVLMIYNIQFKLAQAVQKLKLYTKDAKLWKIEDKLLLAANRHLAIAPYVLAPQRIETILGSLSRLKTNANENQDDNEIIVVPESIVDNWGEENSTEPTHFSLEGVPRNIAKQIFAFVNEGLNDAVIQEILIPQLIESKDISTIIWCLGNFNDVPEKLLIELLSFCLRTSDDTFLPIQNGTITDESKSTNLFSRNDFLDKIFSTSYSDIFLLSYLKAGLKFDEILRLLDYLIRKLDISEDSDENLIEPNVSQLLEWSSLLIDSHYQHYLLSQDSKVLNLLNKLNSILEEYFQLIGDLQDLRPMLERIVNGRLLKPTLQNFNKFYSIEEIKLY